MDTIEILKKYCKQKYGEEVVIKTYSIQEVKDIIDFTKKQCAINGVVKSVCDCERCEDIYRTDVYKCGKCHLKLRT